MFVSGPRLLVSRLASIMTTSSSLPSSPKRETTGNSSGHVATVPPLPDELWGYVARWWPGNFEIGWVLKIRRLSRVLAEVLRYRVVAHCPSTTMFIRELRFIHTFHVRWSREGREQYARVFNMIYCRFNERVPKVRLDEVERRTGQYHTELLAWMEARVELLPEAFDGVVVRLNHSWARWYLARLGRCDLETSFKRMREKSTL